MKNRLTLQQRLIFPIALLGLITLLSNILAVFNINNVNSNAGTIVNDYHFITDREYSGCPRVNEFAGVVKTVIVHGDDG